VPFVRHFVSVFPMLGVCNFRYFYLLTSDVARLVRSGTKQVPRAPETIPWRELDTPEGRMNYLSDPSAFQLSGFAHPGSSMSIPQLYDLARKLCTTSVTLFRSPHLPDSTLQGDTSPPNSPVPSTIQPLFLPSPSTITPSSPTGGSSPSPDPECLHTGLAIPSLPNEIIQAPFVLDPSVRLPLALLGSPPIPSTSTVHPATLSADGPVAIYSTSPSQTTSPPATFPAANKEASGSIDTENTAQGQVNSPILDTENTAQGRVNSPVPDADERHIETLGKRKRTKAVAPPVSTRVLRRRVPDSEPTLSRAPNSSLPK
jgi:hypothetical protein